MTACNDCEFHRAMMFTHWCVSDEPEDIFDFKTGKMVRESDLHFFRQFPDNPVYCSDKNIGECPDFQPISEGALNGD